ncbi:hypothetical protein NLI96_g1189 [Meripilus lineatus]|uniref:F-box domain-containing protein n=1 Tax=Meripilus lineatus TaxID=2056292 RepID=A0AAD5VFA1_9APHY|nr:hypothetical protein NLI96_g1189 [Physisporinus lineatus]
MDPSQDISQDISQESPQENTSLPLAVAIEPYAGPLPLPLPSPPPSSPPSPIASSSNTDPSSSLAPPQSNAVTHFIPNLPYYAPAPAGQFIQPGWSPETGLPREVWLNIFYILRQRRSAITLLACALTCRYLRGPAQVMINTLYMRWIRSWMYEDVDQLVEDVRNAPRDAKLITSIFFIPDRTSAKSAVALSVVPLRLAVRFIYGFCVPCYILSCPDVSSARGCILQKSSTSPECGKRAQETQSAIDETSSAAIYVE